MGALKQQQQRLRLLDSLCKANYYRLAMFTVPFVSGLHMVMMLMLVREDDTHIQNLLTFPCPEEESKVYVAGKG